MQLSKRLKVILLCSLLVFGYVFYIVSGNKYNSVYDNSINEIEGKIVEIRKYDNRYSFILKGKEKILVNYYGENHFNLKIGDLVRVKGKITIPKDNSVFYLFNYRKYLLSKKIYVTFVMDDLDVVSADKNIFYEFKNKIYDRLVKFDNAYMNAFIIGENIIDDEIYESYQINGISHLLAISGSHVTILSFVLIFILNLFIKNKNFNIVIVFLFLIFYIFLTNFLASIIRSVLMYIGINGVKMFKINVSTFEVLYIILLLLLIYNPFYIYDLGFKFSFVVSFYLILFNKLINKYHNYFVKVFIISLIAFLSSMPILINSYFCINLLAPILNVIFVPLVTFILFPLSLLVFIFPVLTTVFVFCTNIFEWLSLVLSKIAVNMYLSYIPMFVFLLYYVVISYILVGMVKGNYKRFLILFLIIFIHYNINYLRFYPELTVIDVGQGDAHLIILPHNKGNILIDTGGNDYDLTKRVLIPYLSASGVKKIDYLILTHGDFDHLGNSISLVNKFKVSNVILNSYSDNDLEKSLIKVLENKKISYYRFSKNKLNINGYYFNFLNGIYYKENNDSLVVYTNLNNANILFMGDAGKKEELKIIQEYNLKDVDILKIGHHGSKTSTSNEFLNEINPLIAIIPVALNNRYGHPNKEVLNSLEKRNIDIYLTSVDGSIKFIFKKDLIIKTAVIGSR